MLYKLSVNIVLFIALNNTDLLSLVLHNQVFSNVSREELRCLSTEVVRDGPLVPQVEGADRFEDSCVLN